MAKMEEDDDGNVKKLREAHVTSLSVLRTHRKLGIATKLMRAAHHQMKKVFQCDCVSLHVRVTNRAALALYKDVLGYEIKSVDSSYYADKEDAYDMRLVFDKKDEEESKATEIDATGKGTSDQYAETNHKAAGPKGEAKGDEEEKEGETTTASKHKKKRNKKKKAKQEQEGAEENTAKE